MKKSTAYVFQLTSLWLKLAILILMALTFLLVVLLLPNNSFTNAIGVVDFQFRFNSLKSAIYWQSRVLMNPYKEVEHSVVYGHINSIDQYGYIEAIVPVEDRFETKKFSLAVLQIRDYKSLSKFFQERRNFGVKFELYGNMAVLHSDNLPDSFTPRVPLNIQFIEKGYAVADPNPPSNIVDSAFAAYYWSIVRGKSVENTY